MNVLSVKKHTNCRICKSPDLVQFLDFGMHPLANSFLRKEDLHKPEARYPLGVCFCKNCNLVQLSDVVSADVLFRDYIYFSSGMPSSKHFNEYAYEVSSMLSNPDDLVVEIGSNDGHLLSVIRDLGARILGIDPAFNIARIANERGVNTLPEFFSEQIAYKVAQEYGEARVIIGNNVVAHINDHHDLIKGVDALLADDGVFIFEAPYILDMFENLAFDSIYHEHLSYLAVRPLAKLLSQFGFEIFDVKIFGVQGNSLRVYAGRYGTHRIESVVGELIKKEENLRLGELSSYISLASKIESRKKEIIDVLTALKRDGKRIASYGAPARGNTLLNYFGIGNQTLDFATEALPSKIGLYTPGARIPVVDVEWARKNPPDYYLMLAWNYKDAILEKEKEFRAKGGKFIIPIGEERII